MKPHHTPMQVTPLASRTPCGMLVSVAAELADEVVAVLAPLQILKVAHVPAARARMVATWPLVVVLGVRPPGEDLEEIRATANDISAQVVITTDFPDPTRLMLELAAAKRAATQTRDKGLWPSGRGPRPR